MHHFRYAKGQLYCEDVPVSELVSEHGSPLYIYSSKTLVDHYSGVMIDKRLAWQAY